jgi:diguanylate cyclase (GGDEF)-like protein
MANIHKSLLDTLFLTPLSPELDHYRILVIKVLTYLLILTLITESASAFISGFYTIGFVELGCLGMYFYTLTKTSKAPHILGNLFIIVFCSISVTAIFFELENTAILFFQAIMPVIIIFFLGLRKAIIWITLITVLFLGNIFLYYLQHEHLPWEPGLLIFSLFVFILCLLFTIAYEKTNQLMLTKLQTQAELDELTQIFNRRKFYELLNKEIENYQRYAQAFSLAIIDLDKFKSVNDTHGHNTGDKVLKEVVHTINCNLRATDILARYGGEEFAVLLPNSDIESARIAMENTRKLIDNHLFVDVFHCTVSIGITQYQENDSINQFIHRADTALYMAKEQGRNKVVAQL